MKRISNWGSRIYRFCFCSTTFVTGDIRVTVLDNFMYHQNSFLDVCYHTGLKVIKGDIRDKRQLKTLIQKHDILVPLAAIVGAPACEKDLILARDINQVQIENIAKWVSNDQMVLYPVTNSGYGIGQKGIYCDESTFKSYFTLWKN